ncbi:MAG: prolyl oligopeptidase family serine peptidase [Planctomycetaceae bacterium]
MDKVAWFVFCLTVLCMAPPAAVRAEDKKTATIDVTGTQNAPTFSRQEVIYGRKDGAALTMDVFNPKNKSKGIGVIVAVSAAWVSGREVMAITEPLIVQPLLENGYVVFAVCHGKYGIPEIVEDMDRAVRFIRYSAKEYDIDPARLGMIGGSAGGHLSLIQGCAATDGNPVASDPVDRQASRVQAVVAFFPPTDFLNWGEAGKPILSTPVVSSIKGAFQFRKPGGATGAFTEITDEKERLEICKQISPINLISRDDPPILIIHGDKDQLVPVQQSQSIAARLREAGVKSEVIIKPGGGHDLGLVKECMPKAIEWFDTVLTAARSDSGR